MKIPEQYNRLMPYLIIPDTANFLAFMKAVFNAEEQMIVPRADGGIMHGEIRIGDAVIMFSNVTEQFSAKPAGMFIYVDDVKETYAKAIAAGATSIMEPAQQSYGFSCGFKDAFGNDWWPCEGE